MTLETLPKLFVWPRSRPAVSVAAFVCYGVAVLLYVWTLIRVEDGKSRGRALVPLLFVLVFVVLYLPHPMAGLKAARYLIAAGTMFTCAVFAGAVSVGNRKRRRVAWTVLAGWVLFNACSAVATACLKAGTKTAVEERFQRAVDAALGAGLRHVIILGSSIDGLDGQSLTFAARDRVRFVSAYHERHDPSAQDAETDPANAFLCKYGNLGKVKRALASAGITSYVTGTGWYCLIHSIEIPRVRHRSVAPGTMQARIRGEPDGAECLLDRMSGTKLRPNRNGEPTTVVIDLQRQLLVDGLWMVGTSSGKPPRKFRIAVSGDDDAYTPVWESERQVRAYVCGNQVYAMGFAPRTELRCEPVRTRFIRLETSSKRSWELGEIYVFEHLGPGDAVSSGEIDDIVREIRARGIDFTATDRWLSAELRKRIPASRDSPVAFPRPNPRHRYTILDRDFRPRQGLAFVVPVSLAEECRATLRGAIVRGVELVRVDFPHYTLFTFEGPEAVFKDLPRVLRWNGHTVLLTALTDVF